MVPALNLPCHITEALLELQGGQSAHSKRQGAGYMKVV